MSSNVSHPVNNYACSDAESRHLTSQQDVYDRTEETLESALRDEKNILLTAPPGAGKTTGLFKIASRLDTPITYLTGLEERYEDGERLADEFGVDATVIPSPHRACPAFDKGSEHYDPEAVRLYGLGANAGQMHTELSLHGGSDCRYSDFWDGFDPNDHPVLIGHYKHAHVPSLTNNRLVVIDEFPGEQLERTIDNPGGAINPFLDQTDEIPFNSVTDIIEYRDDSEQALKVGEWIAENESEISSHEIINSDENRRYNSLAPLLALSLCYTKNVDDEIEYFRFNEADEGSACYIDNRDRRVVFNRKAGTLHVLTVPDLSEARSVVGLDGTGTKELWDLSTGLGLEERSIFADENEERGYYHDIHGATVYQLTDHLKPLHNGNISEERVKGILYGIEAKHGEKPALITPDKALSSCKDSGLLDHVSESINYAKVPSNNDLKHERIELALGCPHPNNDVLKMWGAFSGQEIGQEGEGADKTFGEYGDKIYHHFVHNQVLQAILRAGRAPDIEPTVYVETSAIPDVLEIQPASVEKFDTEKKRKIADHLQRVGDDGTTKKAIMAESGVSQRTVEERLNDFKDHGIVDEEREDSHPYRKVYRWPS
ncbi:hypothetical protein [Saliphagus sp. LR7]|uniref:hypothetical protein n=1 Tax=Saliphagus sp. LR7 TaxID=2282654 RepID=UPI00130094F9|nr:hypothetical protein [Saliphagus sp. LR7]